MKKQLVTACMGFAALTSFGAEMTLPKNVYILTNQDTGAYYFEVITPNVVAWGGGVCTNVPYDITNAISVSAGFTHAIAMRADGTLVSWGDNTFGETNIPSDAETNSIAYAAGQYYSASVLADGTGEMWGASGNAYFGSGLTNLSIAGNPNDVEVLALTSGGDALDYVNGSLSFDTGYNNAVAFIGTTNSHPIYMVLFNDGTVTNWGGVLGNATNVPASATNVIQIAQLSSTNYALCADGYVLRWNPTNGFSALDTSTNEAQIASYIGNSFVLRTNGTVVRYAGNLNVPSGLPLASSISVGYTYGLLVELP